MSAEDFILNNLNNCIVIKDDNYNGYYLITSVSIQRQKKLCRITGDKFKLNRNDKDIKILFDINIKKNQFRLHEDNISLILEKYYTFTEIRIVLNKILKNINLNKFVSDSLYSVDNLKLPKHFKIIDTNLRNIHKYI